MVRCEMKGFLRWVGLRLVRVEVGLRWFAMDLGLGWGVKS